MKNMDISIQIAISISGSLITLIVGYYTAYGKLKDSINEKDSIMKEKIHELELEMKDLKHKDELQQMVIDNLDRNFQNIVTKINNELNAKKNVK